MIMEISDEVLKKIPIFSGIKEEHLENLKKIIQIQEFPENAVVIREGEKGEEIYILLNGEVEVSKSAGFEFTRIGTKREIFDEAFRRWFSIFRRNGFI